MSQSPVLSPSYHQRPFSLLKAHSCLLIRNRFDFSNIRCSPQVLLLHAATFLCFYPGLGWLRLLRLFGFSVRAHVLCLPGRRCRAPSIGLRFHPPPCTSPARQGVHKMPVAPVSPASLPDFSPSFSTLKPKEKGYANTMPNVHERIPVIAQELLAFTHTSFPNKRTNKLGNLKRLIYALKNNPVEHSVGTSFF